MKTNDNFIYAIDKKTNKIVDVLSVPNGKECGCICPNSDCSASLIAIANYQKRNNKIWKKSAHFRHESDVYCSGTEESIIHRYAKQIIEEDKSFFFKKYDILIEAEDFMGVQYKSGCYRAFNTIIKLHNVQQEAQHGNIRADVLAELLIAGQTYPLNIEIHVTHPVDDQKLQKIKKMDLSTIEIDLSDLLEEATNPDLRQLLRKALQAPERQTWLHVSDTLTEKLTKERRAKLKALVEERNTSIKQWMDSLSFVDLPDLADFEADYTGLYRGKNIFTPLPESEIQPLYQQFSRPTRVMHEGKNHFIFSYDGARGVDAFYIDQTFNLSSRSDRKELVKLYQYYAENVAFRSTDNFFLFHTDFKGNDHFYWKNDQIRQVLVDYKAEMNERKKNVDTDLYYCNLDVEQAREIQVQIKILKARLKFINTPEQKADLQAQLKEQRSRMEHYMRNRKWS
ncbi:hypothetical protein CFI10_11510 [Marinobacterium iners]|uniref:hypothetical protein n=1 Tax=Marinobacterium iners TaxID=48076 RepID=UPI001A8C762C|nr:hypothetical protein [Marinobacterium iners]QSR35616.1 hypothetical protein CFI10_11510 [Marinobacterium iners]